MLIRVGMLILVVLLLSACGNNEDSPTPVLGCEASGNMTPDCRFQNPEDFALVPGTDQLIVSEFGSMDGSKPGALSAYSLNDNAIHSLFPVDHDDSRDWGDSHCEPPAQDSFAPHGIDLQQRDDGKLMLLVVNHGGRESIEFFEVTPPAEVSWKGCVEAPTHAWFNDIVGSANGGFWATHMMPKDDQTWVTIKGVFGFDTGFVYRWDPDGGFSKVIGSDGAFPNGIEKSEDEQYLFINMYLGGEVRKLALATGEVVAMTKASGPDNVTWSQDGYLLVASHTAGMSELMACQEVKKGACGYEYEIVRVDPDDMSRSTLVKHRGAPLGGVTVATDTGSELVLGTFAGDRLVRMPRPEIDRK